MANGLSAGCCCGCAECIGYQVSFLYDWHDLVDASFTHDGTQVRIALLFDTSGQTGFGVSFKGAPRLQGTRITNAAGTEVGSIGRLYASALLPSSNAEFDTWFAGAVTPLDSQPDGIPTAPIDGVLWMFRYNSSTPINDFNRNLYLGSKFNFFRSSNSGDRAALNSYPDWRTLFVRESEGVYRTLTPLPRMELEVSLNDFPATPVDDVSAGIEIFHVDDADVEHQLFQRTVTSRLVTDSIQYRAVGSPNQQLDALTSGRVIEVDGTGGYGILAFQPAGVGAQWQYYGSSWSTSTTAVHPYQFRIKPRGVQTAGVQFIDQYPAWAVPTFLYSQANTPVNLHPFDGAMFLRVNLTNMNRQHYGCRVQQRMNREFGTASLCNNNPINQEVVASYGSTNLFPDRIVLGDTTLTPRFNSSAFNGPSHVSSQQSAARFPWYTPTDYRLTYSTDGGEKSFEPSPRLAVNTLFYALYADCTSFDDAGNGVLNHLLVPPSTATALDPPSYPLAINPFNEANRFYRRYVHRRHFYWAGDGWQYQGQDHVPALSAIPDETTINLIAGSIANHHPDATESQRVFWFRICNRYYTINAAGELARAVDSDFERFEPEILLVGELLSLSSTALAGGDNANELSFVVNTAGFFPRAYDPVFPASGPTTFSFIKKVPYFDNAKRPAITIDVNDFWQKASGTGLPSPIGTNHVVTPKLVRATVVAGAGNWTVTERSEFHSQPLSTISIQFDALP